MALLPRSDLPDLLPSLPRDGGLLVLGRLDAEAASAIVAAGHAPCALPSGDRQCAALAAAGRIRRWFSPEPIGLWAPGRIDGGNHRMTAALAGASFPSVLLLGRHPPRVKSWLFGIALHSLVRERMGEVLRVPADQILDLSAVLYSRVLDLVTAEVPLEPTCELRAELDDWQTEVREQGWRGRVSP